MAHRLRERPSAAAEIAMITQLETARPLDPIHAPYSIAPVEVPRQRGQPTRDRKSHCTATRAGDRVQPGASATGGAGSARARTSPSTTAAAGSVPRRCQLPNQDRRLAAVQAAARLERGGRRGVAQLSVPSMLPPGADRSETAFRATSRSVRRSARLLLGPLWRMVVLTRIGARSLGRSAPRDCRTPSKHEFS
jgi:hypothetical protein